MFGISRQGYYTHLHVEEKTRKESNVILKKILKVRAQHPKIGGRKMYFMLKNYMEMNHISMGRDKFFDLLAYHNLLIKRRVRRTRTTYSNHWLRKYKNLIKGKKAHFSNEIWVSDITYWHIGDSFLYITLITDAYSRKILGYSVSDNMQTSNTVSALKMALKNMKGLIVAPIHHSDRGVQYCSQEYVRVLKEHHMPISMTESGDPLDNALAERMNGIIKNEYLVGKKARNALEGFEMVSQAVDLYNSVRPHMSCDMHTPNDIYNGNAEPKRRWKNYYTKKIHLKAWSDT